MNQVASSAIEILRTRGRSKVVTVTTVAAAAEEEADEEEDEAEEVEDEEEEEEDATSKDSEMRFEKNRRSLKSGRRERPRKPSKVTELIKSGNERAHRLNPVDVAANINRSVRLSLAKTNIVIGIRVGYHL